MTLYIHLKLQVTAAAGRATVQGNDTVFAGPSQSSHLFQCLCQCTDQQGFIDHGTLLGAEVDMMSMDTIGTMC